MPVTLLDRAIVRPLPAVPTPDVRRDRADRPAASRPSA